MSPAAPRATRLPPSSADPWRQGASVRAQCAARRARAPRAGIHSGVGELEPTRWLPTEYVAELPPELSGDIPTTRDAVQTRSTRSGRRASPGRARVTTFADAAAHGGATITARALVRAGIPSGGDG